MSNLTRLLSKSELYVTPRHIKFMEQPEHMQVPPDHVIMTMAEVAQGRRKHVRTERYSPSSLGMCNRRILLGYYGVTQDQTMVDNLDMMRVGTWMHEGWQREGLTAGYMADVEVWVSDGARLGGSMDALLDDDSVFELKTQRSMVYLKQAGEPAPKYEHLLQTEAYFRCTGMNEASVLYQNRDSGETNEYRYKSTPYMSDKLDELLARLDQHVDQDYLPKMLNDCQTKTGYVYKVCPYKKECMRLHKEGA